MAIKFFSMIIYGYIAALALSLNGCSNFENNTSEDWMVGVSRVQELGFGFKLVSGSEVNNAKIDFEAVRHTSDFYYKDKYLGGSPGPYMDSVISPSGSYAIYGGEKGQIVLFDVKADVARDLTLKSFGSISGVKWNEEKKSAVVSFFENGKHSLKFSLPH